MFGCVINCFRVIVTVVLILRFFTLCLFFLLHLTSQFKVLVAQLVLKIFSVCLSIKSAHDSCCARKCIRASKGCPSKLFFCRCTFACRPIIFLHFTNQTFLLHFVPQHVLLMCGFNKRSAEKRFYTNDAS